MNEKTEGALETFIQEFNAYEAGLFDLKDEAGFAWWDLTRYVVQYALCAERGIHAAQPVVRDPLPLRARRLASQGARLLGDVLRVARAGRVGAVYVFRRRSRALLEAIEASPVPCLVVGGAHSPPHVAIDKQSVALFVRLASRFVRPSPLVIAEADKIDRDIRAKFGSKVDVRRLILGKYAQHRAALVAWRWILARTGRVELVGFVGDDSQKTLVGLANRAGILTREFQHGYMGASHVYYSYPPLPSVPTTLPAEVVVHLDTGDINYPVAKVPCDASRGESHAGHRDIDVLIGASPTRAADTLAIAEALVDKGLVVALKLHPNQTAAPPGFRQVQVHGGDVDFASLARRSHVYVPANPTSTTAFEAVEHGARLVVIDYGGVKLTRMIDGIVSARVDAFDQLYGAVSSQLPPRQ